MPDWLELVRQRLHLLALHSSERDAVHTELAAHLEDAYESLLGEGMSESEAAKRTLCLVNDWQELQQKIHSARIRKDTMTNRVTQLWLPGLLTFTLCMISMELAQKFGPAPHILSLDKGTPILMFYTAWLFVLPVAGAIGAYLAKRAGGSPRMALLSSIFPVLPFAVVFMIAIPVGLAMGDGPVPAAYLIMTIGWVLAPGVALLAGGFLVRLISSRGSTDRTLSMR